MSLSPKFKSAAKRYEAALMGMLQDDHVSTLSIVTSTFVSLTLEVCKRNGHDTDTNIVVDGGDKRDITIHKHKADQAVRITALEAQSAELLAELHKALKEVDRLADKLGMAYDHGSARAVIAKATGSAA